MAVKVFLLGRPGSGKTTVFYTIEKFARKKKKKAIRIREYTILRDMAEQDEFKGKFASIRPNGFDIRDFSIFNESARRLEQQIKAYLFEHAAKDELIFIELARDDYSQAMRSFSNEFLRDAYFFLIEADIATCIKRIRWRAAHPKKTDGHSISDAILKGYYAKDNAHYVDQKFKVDYGILKRVTVIENNGTLRRFKKRIRREGANIIFGYEFDEARESVIKDFMEIEESRRLAFNVAMYGLIAFPLFLLAISYLIDFTHGIKEVLFFVMFPIVGIIVCAWLWHMLVSRLRTHPGGPTSL